MRAGYVRRMSARSRERQHKRKHLGMLAYRHGRKKRRKRGPGPSTGTSKLAAIAMRRCWTTRLRDARRAVQVVLRRRELDYRQALIRQPRRRVRQLVSRSRYQRWYVRELTSDLAFHFSWGPLCGGDAGMSGHAVFGVQGWTVPLPGWILLPFGGCTLQGRTGRVRKVSGGLRRWDLLRPRTVRVSERSVL